MLNPEKDALASHLLENRMYYHERIEKMVYGQALEELGADFRVSFTAMDGSLVSVMELDDRESGKSAVTGSGIVGIPEEEYGKAVRMTILP